MVSKRLDALVRGDAQRAYLGTIDGFWADLVLSEFTFLEDRGGEVQAVRFHQKGDYIHYDGPWGSVILEFTPDNYPMAWIGGRARLRGRSAGFEGELDRLSRERAPGTEMPTLAVLDRDAVARNVRLWAGTLLAATDLF